MFLHTMHAFMEPLTSKPRHEMDQATDFIYIAKHRKSQRDELKLLKVWMKFNSKACAVQRYEFYS